MRSRHVALRRWMLPVRRLPPGNGRTATVRVGTALLAIAAIGMPGTASATATPPPGQWRWPITGAPQGRPEPGGSGSSKPGSTAPEVTRGFEPPDTPYGPGHRGVDLAGEPGVAVVAAGAGRVSYAGTLAGRGVVALAHEGGVRTTYEPVQASVARGQRVEAGHVLGVLSSGHPGCPRRACLHWGALRGHTYFDPVTLLSHGPVRLLPDARGRPTATPPKATSPRHSGYQPGRSERSAPRPHGAGTPQNEDVVAALGVALAGAAAFALARGRGP